MIVHSVIAAIAEKLTLEMVTRTSSSSPIRADLVKAYRFQVSPLTYPRYLWVSGNDPDDITQKDGRVTMDDTERLGIYIPSGEIGGGHYWYRRGVVGLGCYFLAARYSEMIAAQHAYNFLGKATQVIEETQTAGLSDDYGERVYNNPIVYASNFIQGGGPEDQYIWRGTISWQVLTHRVL